MEKTVLHFEPGAVVVSHFGSFPPNQHSGFSVDSKKRPPICPKFGADVFGCVLVGVSILRNDGKQCWAKGDVTHSSSWLENNSRFEKSEENFH